MKQVLTLVILLMAGRTCASARCFREHELGEAAKRQLQSRYPQPEEPPSSAAADSPYTCPVELYQQQLSPHPRERSLSPWRYVTVTKKEYFPSTYVEAQCLCSGCILIPDSSKKHMLPMENHNYNSVPIMQSRVFLRRELCRDGERYRLKPETLRVAVGCTCARPKSTF